MTVHNLTVQFFFYLCCQQLKQWLSQKEGVNGTKVKNTVTNIRHARPVSVRKKRTVSLT